MAQKYPLSSDPPAGPCPILPVDTSILTRAMGTTLRIGFPLQENSSAACDFDTMIEQLDKAAHKTSR